MKQTTERLDIYYRQKSFAHELIELEKWPTSPKNKELILRWHAHLFATGSGEIRVAKLTSQMRKLVLLLQKDLDSAS